MATVPERITWAISQLDLGPGDRVLELGCGPGVAVALVCERLDPAAGGHVTAIDRTATSIQRTAARNPDAVAAGLADLQQTDLASFEAAPGSFDTAFAVNVNVFWTGAADAESAVLARVLRPGGAVHLVYEGPPTGGRHEVGPIVAGNLERHGFATEVRTGPGGRFCCITGRRA